ncbi:MAG: PIN domain-containing protein [Thermoanaerobaculia bacterium]|nr:PIN domain-containing protein [Thermoanaerobaculia bacterium]
MYLLDTNIVLHLIRRTALAETIQQDFRIFQQDQRPIISVVTEGELLSIAIQNGWGLNKRTELQRYLDELLIADIRIKSIIRRYAEIDAFSQGKLPDKPILFSARNMGKNDLWIAATASVLGTKLLTTDEDYTHLDGVFLSVEKVGK